MVVVLVLVLLLYLTALTKGMTYSWEEEMRQRSTEDCTAVSERWWNHFQEREVLIQKGAYRVIRHVFTKDGLKRSPDKVRAIKRGTECLEIKRLCEACYLDNFIKNYAATAAPLYQLTWEETKFYWGKQEETAFRKIQDSISSEETMAFFDPSKPIILLFKASIHEGLSAALLQKSNRGFQPIHFISWTMTETEKNS